MTFDIFICIPLAPRGSTKDRALVCRTSSAEPGRGWGIESGSGSLSGTCSRTHAWVFHTRRACPWPAPSEVVNDHVLRIRPAGAAEVKRHGLAARRPARGCPEVVNDHILKKSSTLETHIKTPVCTLGANLRVSHTCRRILVDLGYGISLHQGP